ncbi:PREDICTED: thyroid peroxidase-like [Branchiostoma belcheri]|uniref:Thyroid peroxidase-like n=1 Tax=Branchiostoma belcheri TaxID=7741 RepID=A0A6P4Y9P9_BRABE|nr:PREDICTED: thyroid peroxidase-like [Branchiostoma belcheri]
MTVRGCPDYAVPRLRPCPGYAGFVPRETAEVNVDVIHDPESPFATSMRTTYRLILMFFAAVAMAPLVVMVTGQGPSEQELQQAVAQATAEVAAEEAANVSVGAEAEESPFSGALNALAREHRSTPMARNLSRCATVLEKVAKHFMSSSRRRTSSYTIAMLSAIDSPNVTSVCDATSMEPVTCPTPAVPEFRSANGRCNNRNHPLWGSSEQPFRRLLEPEYGDGLMTPRTTGSGRDGAPLPSPRLVSTTMHEDLRKSSPVNTHMVMQFGQFLDHDITLTPNFQEEGLVCTCGTDDEHCFNINVPSDDPDFAGRPCLPFARSLSCPNEGCRLGRRQQLNQLTAFVDASNVYGSSDEEIEELREHAEPPVVQATCPAGYQRFQKNCFKAFPQTKPDYSWAMKACLKDEGFLAMPKDAATNAFLVQLKNAVRNDVAFYIGLSDRNAEGQWRFADGTLLGSYKNWSPGEPNNSGNEDCANLRPGSGGKWNDVPCSIDRRYICQVPPIHPGCSQKATGTTYKYRWDLPQLTGTRFTFQVSAYKAAHIGLSPENHDVTNMYEIVIGGWSNTKSAIRLGKQGETRALVSTPGIISATEYRTFWINLAPDGTISVGKGGVSQPFMSWRDPNPIRVSYAGYSTRSGATGRWKFCSNEGARGLLKSRPNPLDANKKELLPASIADEAVCAEFTGNETCSQAGDIRVNEQPGLTSMHTVFLREHNRIARQLSGLNPHWDDDRVFFETRKIVGALMQKITYGEDLPYVLGPDAMTKFHLTLLQSGFFSGYDVSVNPTISNVFATAAYRSGHSLVNERQFRLPPDFNQGSLCPIQLDFAFFNPSHVLNNDLGGVDSILRGLTAQPHQDVDRFMVSSLTKHLFADPPGSLGLDLAALNIQRGRDHGLPGYNAWRVTCGLSGATTFSALGTEIPDVNTRKILGKLYSHVNDIDVFVGGLAEESVPGGVVGPTFACLIGLQFQALRMGDRFWFENEGQFTAAQLAEIRKTSLARILCDNTDGTTHMQPDVFRLPTQSGNERVACSSLPQMDLTKWQESVSNSSGLPESLEEENVTMSGREFDDHDADEELERVAEEARILLELLRGKQEDLPPPEENLPPPEENLPPPPEDLTPPEENLTPPEENFPPPEEDLTPPEENLTPPEENLPPPKDIYRTLLDLLRGKQDDIYPEKNTGSGGELDTNDIGYIDPEEYGQDMANNLE